MALEFEGELTFSVAGPAGDTAGTVTGDGGVLRVRADDPAAAWDASLGSVSTGPALLSTVAQRLHDEGVVMEVSGPDGLVATVGAGVQSPLGRLVAGSRHVRPGRPAALRPLALAAARRTARGLARPAALVVAALVALEALRRAARR